MGIQQNINRSPLGFRLKKKTLIFCLNIFLYIPRSSIIITCRIEERRNNNSLSIFFLLTCLSRLALPPMWWICFPHRIEMRRQAEGVQDPWLPCRLCDATLGLWSGCLTSAPPLQTVLSSIYVTCSQQCWAQWILSNCSLFMLLCEDLFFILKSASAVKNNST